MSAAQKSLELQRTVKHNAEEVHNQLNDLYKWEKEMKDKERDLKRQPAASGANEITAPVRSQVADNKAAGDVKQNAVAKQTTKAPNSTTTTTMTSEKLDLPQDAAAQRHQEANLLKDRGNNLVKQTQYEDAIVAYTAAIDIFNADPIYYCNRALCYLKLERYDDCIEDCERALVLDKLSVKAYYRRMQANESLGNNMDALKDCTTVLSIEPKNVEAKKSLQRINERLRKDTVPAISGPYFTTKRADQIDITPIDKPANLRSKRPLQRVPIVDVVAPKASKDEQKPELRISDEDIDKLFNYNCGPFEEVKKNTVQPKTKTAAPCASAHLETVKVETKSPAAQKTVEAPTQAVETEKAAATTKTITIEEISTPKTTTPTQQKPQTKKAAENVLKTDLAATKQQKQRPLPPAPTCTAQFYTNWKDLTSPQKYDYLKSIEIPQLCKILGAGFDSETLLDLLNTLHDYYVPQKDPKLAATLLELSKNSQIGILSMLMSAEEKIVLNEIVAALKTSLGDKSNELAMITKNFSLN